jgi:hypothetical protein
MCESESRDVLVIPSSEVSLIELLRDKRKLSENLLSVRPPTGSVDLQMAISDYWNDLD